MDTPDLAIELPTGTGKTLVALLILGFWRRQGLRVAMLCGNKVLARQNLAQAQQLGVQAVLFEGSGPELSPVNLRSYSRAQSIGIMNYWVYFNTNPTVSDAECLVFDDAHLAEGALSSMFSMTIQKDEQTELYEALLKEIDSRFPYYSLIRDILGGTPVLERTTELISFYDSWEVADRFTELIDSSPYTQENGSLFFEWRNVRDILKLCLCFVSQYEIEFRPYVFPTRELSYYRNPRQRIYMSATIGQVGDLQRRLGSNPIIKLPVPREFQEILPGKRLFLFDQHTSQRTPIGPSGPMLNCLWQLLQAKQKSIWLCRSRREAMQWKEIVDGWLAKFGISDQRT